MEPRGLAKLLQGPKKFWDIHGKILQDRYGDRVIDILQLPFKIVLSPITLAFDLVDSAPRGFGVPKLASDLAFKAIFVVGVLGTYDIALEMGKKVLCPRNCRSCNGWQSLCCTMCKGTGTVHYQVQNYRLRSGERPTAESIAEAVIDNRAELVHLPSAVDLPFPMPSKQCADCGGTGVMCCPECKDRRLNIRISADNIMEPPWIAYNVLRRMNYPNENIVQSMKDPKIANFWLITMPQIMGGFNFDDNDKKKIWWRYKESMQYNQLRDVVAKREPGWEHLQNILISVDPNRAKEDPVIVRNVPYYKAKQALQAEVMNLVVPPRPKDWGSQELDLPLNASTWTEEELKDPSKKSEMASLLNAQREMADSILDAQWERKWREDKLVEGIKEKTHAYVQSADDVLPEPIIMPSQGKKKRNQLVEEMAPFMSGRTETRLPQSLILQCQELEKKKAARRRRWWFF